MTLVGRQLGRYRILDELGSGGMSVVYKGVDTALEREVAVKVLHPHLANKDESRKRLAREAKAVAKLHHTNILEVFDFSAASADDSYIVTEYIRGQTLRAFIDKEAMSPPEIAAMVIHVVASALAHAHEAGVIHRDLKPENVMVRDDGVLKLMDFGIAKIVDRDERMTMTGALVGSPSHMAPEIIHGEEAGPESDVFSLGTMLYLFATGQLPFSAGTTSGILRKILDAPFEDPRTLSPAISDELAEIIGKCLAKAPSDRYPDAAALRDALASYLGPFGLERTDEELASFFATPAAYRAQLTARLIDALVSRAAQYRAEKRTARALSCVNQVLALQPEHAKALALLAEMSAARRRQQTVSKLKRIGLAGGGIALLLALAVAGYRAGPEPKQATPPPPIAEAPPAVPAPTPEDVPDVEPAKPMVPEAPPVEITKANAPKAPDERKAAKPKPALIPVTLQVRPYGYVMIDGGARSKQPLQHHVVKLTPGKHTVAVTCDLGCDTIAEEIEVVPGGENLFRLRVQLKPSTLAFAYEPPDAVVRIGNQTRTVRDSQQRPFEIRSARGPSMLKHQVSFEISRPGFQTRREVVTIAAGEQARLEGSLKPE